jgi:hypothetical protein
MPGLPPILLAPLNPLPSPVTLLQVKDVLAISKMVQNLVFHHQLSPLLTSSDSPSSSAMAVDIEDIPLDSRSRVLSFDPWIESYPALPISADDQTWMAWLAKALENEVPTDVLELFIKTLATMPKSPAMAKFVWMQIKRLRNLVSNPGT